MTIVIEVSNLTRNHTNSHHVANDRRAVATALRRAGGPSPLEPNQRVALARTGPLLEHPAGAMPRARGRVRTPSSLSRPRAIILQLEPPQGSRRRRQDTKPDAAASGNEGKADDLPAVLARARSGAACRDGLS